MSVLYERPAPIPGVNVTLSIAEHPAKYEEASMLIGMVKILNEEHPENASAPNVGDESGILSDDRLEHP